MRVIAYIPGDAMSLTDEGLACAMTVNENLHSLGLTLTPRDIASLAVSPSRMTLYQDTALLLPEVKADPMYPDFPRQVLEISEAQFRFHQAMHYFSTYGMDICFGIHVDKGWLPEVGSTLKTEKDERLLDYTVVELVPCQEICAFALERILGRRERMTLPEQELVLLAARQVPPETFRSIKVRFKENIQLLFSDIVEKYSSEEARMVLSGLCQHTGDVLKNIRVLMKERRYHLHTREKRLFVKLLESYPVSDLKENLIRSAKERERNLAVLDHLDYNQYSRSPLHAKAVSDLRDGKLQSWESRMKKLLAEHDEKALSFAAARPGTMVRMVSWLLELGYDEEAITQALCKNAASLSAQTLVKLVGSLRKESEEELLAEEKQMILQAETKCQQELYLANEDGYRNRYIQEKNSRYWNFQNALESIREKKHREIEPLESIVLDYEARKQKLLEEIRDMVEFHNSERKRSIRSLEALLKDTKEKLQTYQAMVRYRDRVLEAGADPMDSTAILAGKQAEYALKRISSLSGKTARLEEKLSSLKEETLTCERDVLHTLRPDLKQKELEQEWASRLEEARAPIVRIQESKRAEEHQIQLAYEENERRQEEKFQKYLKKMQSLWGSSCKKIFQRQEKEKKAIHDLYRKRILRLKTAPARKRIFSRALLAHFQTIQTPIKGKRIFLDEGRFDLALSVLELNAKSEDSTYIRSGFSWKIPPEAKTIRFFVYWNDRERVDIDLHAGGAMSFTGPKGEPLMKEVYIGWNRDFRMNGIAHSGDITHSDAAEYIDVPVDCGVRYMFLNINLFSGKDSLKNVEECFVGLMAVKNTRQNVKHYSHENCFFTHEIHQDCRRLYYGYIDLEKGIVRFIGKPNFEGYYSTFKLEDPDQCFSVQEYLQLLIEGQGAVLVPREEAEVVLTMEKSSDPNAICLADENFFLDSVSK